MKHTLSALVAVPVLALGMLLPGVSQAKQTKLVEAAQGRVNVEAYVDLDGNGAYTPDAGEGKFFYNTTYAVFGLNGKPVKNTWCTNPMAPWGGKLGGAGRGSCHLPVGTYAVQLFGVDGSLFAGPAANPVILQVANKQTYTASFAFTLKGGEVDVRAYVDKDGNREYTPNGGEGKLFSNAPYRIIALQGANKGKQIDYYRFCAYAKPKLGGAGRAFCRGLAPGMYLVSFDGAGQAKHGKQFGNEFNPNGQNPYVVAVYPGQVSTIDFGYKVAAAKKK